MTKEPKLYWPISKLHTWEKNPRDIKPEDFERLKQQIRDLGEYKPLIVTPIGGVIGGNMRFRAYQDLGFKECWVSIVSPKDEAEKIKYALSDNDRVGYYVKEDIATMMGELPDDTNWAEEFGNFRVDLGKSVSIDSIIAEAQGVDESEDEVPEISEGISLVKEGDLFQLGAHRLLCGDSRKIEDVQKLVGDIHPNLIFTDPPYGVDFAGAKYNPRAKEWEGIKNDKNQGEDLYLFIRDCLSNAVSVCNPATPVYVWSAPMLEGFHLLRGLIDSGIHVQSQLIWYKNTIVLGQADYQWKHEICWYGYTEGQHHYWNGGRSLSTVIEESKDANASYQHPNQKPIALSVGAIKNSCPLSGTVLDLFGGSGSTLIGCEKTERPCLMMEIDPKYCEVIIKRWEKITEKEAIRLSDGKKWKELT